MFRSKYMLLLLLFYTSIYAQVTGYHENYDDGDISTWFVGAEHQRTFQLSVIDSALNINYTRTASSEMWDNFNFTPPQLIDVSANPLISVKIRSTVNTVLTLKPIFENGTDDWIQKSLIGDHAWRTITFEMNLTGELVINRIYCYLDGGTTVLKEGVVQFDNFSIGDSAIVSADVFNLEKAVAQAENLILNSVEGSGIGEFPSGAKSLLQGAINTANSILDSEPEEQDVIDQAAWDLYDACVDFEISVNSPESNLTDANSTIQTRYLYQNLQNLADSFLLFGMQDATGYGVGWSGDDDRGDVKDVCGDFPAVYSEEMTAITRNSGDGRVAYRMTSAYERGGVLTMCWHQYDPLDRGFYQEDVGYERIVTTLLPGGIHHDYYKEKLQKIALFFKSLRGSEGESIPVIFRPYHEHTGNWFWWGPAHCTTEEFNAIWQFTFHYLTDSLNVHNLIWAISPSFQHVGSGEQYFNIYPGDEYVDIFGGDKYFRTNPVPQSEYNEFVAKLQNIAQHSANRNKIPALTEVGNENLTIPNWYTHILLEPLKTDALTYSYAAVWRNAGTTHHFAPYPGHSSVPDFIEFYDDPYTLFEQDLPEMYTLPEDDTTPPQIISEHDTTQIATDTLVHITVKTDERSYLRYDYSDIPYETMVYDFESGQGQFNHATTLRANQGDSKTIYVRARDVWGNQSVASVAITFTVDTMQALIPWTDLSYPANEWPIGPAPLGTGTNVNTTTQNVRTIYFRKSVDFAEKPATMAVLIKSQGGAILYVNTHEVARINIPAEAEIDYDTAPASTGFINKSITFSAEALAYLKAGKNAFAVEAHMPVGSAIESFDAQIFNQSGILAPLGSEWAYFDLGRAPAGIKRADIVGLSEEQLQNPVTFELYQNYPNPFNPFTNIRFSLPRSGPVQLQVFDVSGKLVTTLADKSLNAGSYKVVMNGSHYASGIYYYRLVFGSQSRVKPMLLIK